MLTTPSQLRRLLQLPALRGRDAGLLRHRPGHPQHRPGGRRGERGRAHGGDPARAHLRLPSRPARARARSLTRAGIPMLEDACQALGARRREGPAPSAPPDPAGLRLLRQQADDDRRGRRPDPRRRRDGRALPQRAQPGPRPRHVPGRPLGDRVQLPHDRHPGRDRDRAARALRRAARGAGRRSRRPTPSASRELGAPAGEGDPDGLVLPCADRGDERAQLVRLHRAAARRPRTATT